MGDGIVPSIDGDGSCFGPLMGGLAADLLGYRAPFFMFSILSGLCLLAVYLLMPNLQHTHKVDSNESQWALIKSFPCYPTCTIARGYAIFM